MSNPDLDKLLDTLLTFARDSLSKRGAFSPFGATMNANRQIRLAAAYEADEGTVKGHWDLLVEGMRAETRASTTIACGICIDARVTPPKLTSPVDAIRVHLEHQDSPSADVFLPYERTVSGEIKYGKLFAVKAASQIFQHREL